MWPFTKKKPPLPALSSVKTKPLVSEDWLDENIIQRVQKKHPDWSRSKVVELIREYKNFLYVCARDESESVPSAEVDEIWHEHILFTKEYEDWCNFLGRKIHHNPEKIGEKKSYEADFQKTKSKIADLSVNLKETKPVKLTPSKTYKKSKSSYSPKSSPSSKSSKLYESSPSYHSDGLVDNLLLYGVTNNIGNDCGESYSGHSHSGDSGCSHDSGASSCSSGSSSSSCSSSSCSSSSCSSSSCGGSSCSS